MNNPPELKSCPFCDDIPYGTKTRSGPIEYTHRENDCILEGIRFMSVESWNQRTSPEPWRACGADKGGCQCHIIWSLEKDKPIAQTYNSKQAESEMEEGEPEANAQRIVDCVNECAGLTVEEIKIAINLYKEGDWS